MGLRKSSVPIRGYPGSSNRRIKHRTLILAVTLLIAAAAIGVVGLNRAPVASAATGPIFTVMNTSETPPDGVWFRRSPHTADTDRVTGHGVWMNERVQLECYAWGDAVGAYNNRLWYKVLNVTRPTNAGVANEGYLNAHYINDGLAANQIDAGVPQCGPPPPAPSPTPTPTSTPTPTEYPVAYYSGINGAGAPQARSLDVARVLTDNGTYDGNWKSSTQCMPSSNAVNFAGKDITRLAGWSLGRLGPIYALKYMKDHNPAAAKRINYVIMFDPGPPSDFGVCDYNQTTVQADSTLAWWLGLSSDNRLVILAGKLTATNHHHSIQTAYFPAIKRAGQAIRDRVLVCNYNDLDHSTVYDKYQKQMIDPRIPTTQGLSSCPKEGSSSVWGWNP
jgi:hypothetical protein